jgi:hypothetical protein
MDKTFYWFMVTAQWSTEDDNGKMKKIKEKYLVKAVSPTDAESIITKDFEGSSIKFRNIDMKEINITKILVPENVELND